MDNWRSLVAVVVFCALLEIYHGFPFNVNTETRTPDNWQVNIVLFTYFILFNSLLKNNISSCISFEFWYLMNC